ncbi:hypothetical protein R1flu_013589 [Riccia fluitans]|uniref:Glutathione peroxidase n=1 Tax=Riccia fluitans TaxID=41844 RepID=A0ABD1YDU2_9MARC
MTTSKYPIVLVAVLVVALVVPVLFVPSTPSSTPYKTAAHLIAPGNVKGVFTTAQTFVNIFGRHLLSPLFSSMGSKPSIPAMSQQSVHEFTVKDSSGNDVDLSIYKGKVLLIVNVASQCGLTNTNYKELTEVYSKYKDQGLEILAFPCNQFGSQEPGTNEEIKNFACTRFKAEYPIFDKINVNGENADPLYKFLKHSKGGGILGESIKWNFSKFLVDKDGKVVDRYAPTTSPSKIEKDIKKLL